MGMFEDLHKLDKADKAKKAQEQAAKQIKPAPSPVTPTPSQEGKREVGREGSREPSLDGKREGGKEGNDLTTTLGTHLYDLNIKPNRKDSFLFTDAEFFELKHVKLELQEQYELDVGKDDIVRTAFRMLFRDYRKHGEQSELVKTLRDKRGK
jgi:hypothetical protein